MQILKKQGILLFWMVLLLDCYYIYSGQASYRVFTSILLMPILIFYIFLNARKNYYHNTKTLVFIAFVSAWVGHLLLLNHSQVFFILAIIAFMCTVVFYSITFYRMQKLKLSKCQEAFIAFLVLGVGFFQLYKLISSRLEDLKIPVIIYMVALTVMTSLVANLFSSGMRKPVAISNFIPAALLFIVSNIVLALQLFLFTDIDFLGVVVVLSYGYSQSLFAEGFTKILKG